MLGRGGQRDALEVRPLFLIVKKKGHPLANVDDKAAKHRFDQRRHRVEFFEREGEGNFLFDRDWLSHEWRGYDLFPYRQSQTDLMFPQSDLIAAIGSRFAARHAG